MPGLNGTVRGRVGARFSLLHERISKRGSAVSTLADRFSRNSRNFRTQGREVGRERLAQRGGWLLRHNAGSHSSVGKTGAEIFPACCRKNNQLHMILRLSGLEPLNITPEFGFVV